MSDVYSRWITNNEYFSAAISHQKSDDRYHVHIKYLGFDILDECHNSWNEAVKVRKETLRALNLYPS